MTFELSIPLNNSNQKLTIESLVIVGANGSGKSRLGVAIEELHPNSHRISAQRSLVFKEEIEVKSIIAAEMLQRFGNFSQQKHWGEEQNRKYAMDQKMNSRWGSRPTSHLLEDFDHILSVLVAHENAENLLFKREYQSGVRPDQYPVSKQDRVIHVWNRVMIHRDVEISDNRLYAKDSSENRFNGIEMSDGERVAFYLIAQSICAPANALVIIDEPEIHLHRSVQYRLWDAIEAERPDCAFVYITHDLEFAASRSRAKLIWVKKFDGKKWDWEDVACVDSFPMELTLEILGSRKPILFVEGTHDGIDTQLYKRIYPDFHIVPRESCLKVIESTRSVRNANDLRAIAAFGIIERDYRADPYIRSLQRDFIFATPVAEAENTICLPFIVMAAAKHLHRDEESTFQAVIEAAIKRLQSQLDNQVKERAAQEIRYAFGQFSFKGFTGRESFLQAANDFKAAIDAQSQYDVAVQHYMTIIDQRDYMGLLKSFNCKGLEDDVAKAVGFVNRSTFRNWVLSEIDASLRAENPSAIGAEMLKQLREVFPVLPLTTDSAVAASASSAEVANG